MRKGASRLYARPVRGGEAANVADAVVAVCALACRSALL